MHQRGRDKGYTSDKIRKDTFQKTKELYSKARDIIDSKVDRLGYDSMVDAMKAVETHPDWADRWDARNSLTPEEIATVEDWKKAKQERDSAHAGDTVPDAPWKKNWHEQALRRMLKYAAEKGYSGLSWTPGADQNARYSLSTVADKLKYDEANKKLVVYKDGSAVGSYTGKSPEDLPGIVGKEVAQRLMDQAGEPTHHEADPSHLFVESDFGGRHYVSNRETGKTLGEFKYLANANDAARSGKVPNADAGIRHLEGNDLEVGGSGMKGFYDKIVPDYLNKFGKKFGAKVDTTDIPAETAQDHQEAWEEYRKALKDYDEAIDNNPSMSNRFIKPKEPQPIRKTVQYLPITPEMRESVGKEGVPLFNKEKQVVPVATGYRSMVDTGSLGMIDLAPDDYDLVSKITGGGHNSKARNLSKEGAIDLVDKLIEEANNLSDGPKKNRLIKIAGHISTARKDNGIAGVPIFKVDPNRTPAEQRELEMHEAVVHGGQRAVAGDGNARSLFPESVTNAIGQNILARKAWYALHNAGYDMSDRPLMAIESEAMTLSGKFNRANILTDDEADELMWEHLQAQTAHHGDKLNAVDPTGQRYVQVLREAAERHEEARKNRDFPQFELTGLEQGSGQEKEVPIPSGTAEGGGIEGDQSDSGAGSEGVGDAGEGKPLFNREQVKTPEFKNWFEGSSVVDEDGEPKVVYKAMHPYDWTKETPVSQAERIKGKIPEHGPLIDSIGRTTEFPSFHKDEPGVKIAGFFGDKDTANRFAKGIGTAAVYPSYLSIKKPFVIEADGRKAGVIQFGETGKEFRDAIRSGDYDGVIIKDTPDEGTVYVALKPEQIKSAIGNSGAFDPNDPSILRNRDKFNPAAPDKNTPSDDGYLYHATNHYRASDIANEGLLLHKPWEYTDQEVWPDGSTKKRNYFTPKASSAHSFQPEDGKGALLRVKRDERFKDESGTGDVYSHSIIPPNDLEIMGQDGKWVLLSQAYPKDDDASFNREIPSAEQEESPKTVEPEEQKASTPAPVSVVPVQGGTQLASAPVMVPVVPVPTKNVLPLHKIKEMAAGLNPNHTTHPEVRSVRELMLAAKQRMIP